jgi:hypothetical protein
LLLVNNGDKASLLTEFFDTLSLFGLINKELLFDDDFFDGVKTKNELFFELEFDI